MSRSSDTPLIAASLSTHPVPGVGVPLVPGVGQLGQRRFDVSPAALVVERAAQGCRDEAAAPPTAHPAIELSDELVVDAYV